MPAPASPPTTTPGAIDRAAVELAEAKGTWARRPLRERIELLEGCTRAWIAVAEDAVRAGCAAKGLDPDHASAAEEWLSAPVPIVRNLRLLAESLRDIERHGRPLLPSSAVRPLPVGGQAVRVFPRSWSERLFYPGVTMDVWLDGTGPLAQASAYRPEAPREGRVAAVLGAGNVGSIGTMDALHKLFVENQVALLKMHPVNAYLGPFLERAFAPLLEARALRIVYGDAEEGQRVLHHPAVDEIHMTGSAAVHDRIVWGDTPEEQARRRASGQPRVARRVTSELGCVTPVVLVPGEWSESELRYQAEHVATMVALNASCNCNAAKVLVTARGWPQRGRFLDHLSALLASVPSRRAYYPGSAVKYDRFRAAYPQARALGPRGEDTLPFTTIFDVDASRRDQLAFTEEAWSPVIAETALDAADGADFLDAAVPFCNDALAGTLSAVLLVDPRAQARLGRPRLAAAVAGLRYGTVAVNLWSAASYVLATSPWGAHPGHTLDAVGSGIGFVHNTLMLEGVRKTVLWAPFVARPRPPWFLTHRQSHRVARRMVAFEATPSAARVPAIALNALGVPLP